MLVYILDSSPIQPLHPSLPVPSPPPQNSSFKVQEKAKQ